MDSNTMTHFCFFPTPVPHPPGLVEVCFIPISTSRHISPILVLLSNSVQHNFVSLCFFP